MSATNLRDKWDLSPKNGRPPNCSSWGPPHFETNPNGPNGHDMPQNTDPPINDLLVGRHVGFWQGSRDATRSDSNPQFVGHCKRPRTPPEDPRSSGVRQCERPPKRSSCPVRNCEQLAQNSSDSHGYGSNNRDNTKQ